MKVKRIILSDLIKSTDSISGREFGMCYALDKQILDKVKSNVKIIIIIDDKVKAINDSFIKGFFIKSFEYLKTKEKIKEHFVIVGTPYYQRLFDKNWTIMERMIETKIAWYQKLFK